MDEKKKMNILTEDVTGENIQDVITNSTKITDEIAMEAAEKIAKRRKEKLTNELIEVVQKCEYTISSAVLQVRRSNRTNQRIKTYLKDLAAIAEEIKSGKKPVSTWDKEARELKKQYDKDLMDIGRSIDESCRELDDLFPNAWNIRYSEFVPNRQKLILK